MQNALLYKSKQFFLVLVKMSIVVCAFYFIIHKLKTNTQLDFSIFTDFLFKNDDFSLKNIGFLLFLTIFNWFFEILKWQHLTFIVKKITFFEALEQCLGSLTASLFTPNRVGEYGAKAMYYRTGYRKQIVLLNLIGNIMQMATTSIFGVIGLILFAYHYELLINHTNIIILVAGVLLTGIIIRFFINKLSFTIRGYSLKKIIDYILNLSRDYLFKAFTFSIARYIIFSFQFYFLLLIFKVNLDYFDAMVPITTMYLLASIIPSIFILDVIIKGSVAVYLFAYLGVNELIILSIITIMWLLNFVLPSVFGSYYVLKFKLPKDIVKI
ncbi:hypothetical protein [uncultured Algibacter sp.]|uniref:hypothetical protein n=1 Tax=uncultured Algibacter sp. TaxID=298659 RepID=UPI002612581E|nr:hypothetical protein [uncultured Algibacter sp.]